MFNAIFSHQPSSEVTSSETAYVEVAYVEVAGLMDDFISLEEVAPGSDYAELLAASWGIPCETVAPEVRPSFSLKSIATKMVHTLFQAPRSNMKVA